MFAMHRTTNWMANANIVIAKDRTAKETTAAGLSILA